jgi:hypothetical protein
MEHREETGTPNLITRAWRAGIAGARRVFWLPFVFALVGYVVMTNAAENMDEGPIRWLIQGFGTLMIYYAGEISGARVAVTRVRRATDEIHARCRDAVARPTDDTRMRGGG